MGIIDIFGIIGVFLLMGLALNIISWISGEPIYYVRQKAPLATPDFIPFIAQSIKNWIYKIISPKKYEIQKLRKQIIKESESLMGRLMNVDAHIGSQYFHLSSIEREVLKEKVINQLIQENVEREKEMKEKIKILQK